jgi:hypothetical protein
MFEQPTGVGGCSYCMVRSKSGHSFSSQSSSLLLLLLAAARAVAATSTSLACKHAEWQANRLAVGNISIADHVS